MSTEGEDKKSPPPARIVPLWVIAFFNGWFIMQTELVGARTLTPFFGNSIFVWGSVLAVLMLALAVGYGLGGAVTRKTRSLYTPGAVLLAAGALVCLSTVYQNPLCARLANSTDPRWAALLVSVLLYAAPMTLAGMISPYAVHLATAARAEAGSRAGSLYAVSTVGSFLGCLATSFVLVPSYALQIVTIGAGVLAALTAVVSAVALSVAHRPAVVISLVFSAAAIAAGLYAPAAFESTQQQVYARMMVGEKLSDAAPSTIDARIAQGQRLAIRELNKTRPGTVQTLLKTETAYHRIAVTQEPPFRSLTFGEPGFRMTQTIINLRNIKRHFSEYTELLLAPILYKPDPKRVLVIGLGGADVARGIESCYPEVRMDVVEIDPVVVKIAQKYFFWMPGRNVTVYTLDGRTFAGLHVVNNREPYDWVILDAYDSDYVPFHLSTLEFFDLIKQVLAPDGVISMNTWVTHKLFSYQARTLAGSFGTADAYFGKRSGNVVLAAQKNSPGPMTQERAASAIKRVKLRPGAAVDLRFIASCLLPQPNWVQEGDILTDTWAPVESLMQ